MAQTFATANAPEQPPACDARSVVARIVLVLVIALVALMGWTAYANVFAPDLDVRAHAEKVARDATDCATCDRRRLEGSSSVFAKTYRFTFDKTGVITVVCKRPYLAFGAFACTKQ